jgi:very-short-patch-repair endonuclease
MSQFTKNMDDLLLHLSCKKESLVRHLKKNYKENIHYNVVKNIPPICRNPSGGGQNKILFMLTENVFELLKNSFNLRNRYIVNLSETVKYINIGMCIENQTIGFIENAYHSILNVKRQYRIDKYRVDLYFIDYKLVVECDENDHIDRDCVSEQVREKFIKSFGNKIIRYNPNAEAFDLSNVLKEINAVLFSLKS